MALGVLFGLVLGLGTAYVVDYLCLPEETIVDFNIMDSETGAYNKQYFVQRLGEEMARAKRNKYLLSLGLMHIDNLAMIRGINSTQVRTDFLRQFVSFMKQQLRQEDILAYFENDNFAFLFPDTSGESARAIMEYLENRVSWIAFESEASGAKLNLSSTSSIMTGYDGSGPNELLSKLHAALEKVKSRDKGEVYLLSAKEKAYDVESVSE
jgi:diguanylate cyclase (GGDEF)-like protein